jgi:esterase/lipase
MTVSKNDFWGEEYHHGELVTEGLLSAGYAVLAIDMPYHGDRLYENNFESTQITLFRKGHGFRIRDMVVQSTIEYRRAIDYLETQGDININRIGAIGYSLGSVVTFNLIGVDNRIKTIVVCNTAVINPRTFSLPEEYLSGIAPQTFIPYLYEKPILILAARNDRFNCTIQEAVQLYNMINGESKELIFYDSKHRLPPEHATKAVEWLIKNL